MKQYQELLRRILDEGVTKKDRTGTGTISVFGHQMRFDLSKGFPLITTKKMFTRGIIEELLWMLSGDTNVRTLQEKNVHIWDGWADEDGNLGRVYGAQWRDWIASDGSHIDQISQVVNQIKTNPNDRRMIVCAWNVGEIDQMALPPCHCFYQFYVADGKLSCQLYQRSADTFLGMPFNIASYSLLTMMMAQVCDLGVGDFVYTTGDTHIYLNHIEQVKEQLTREPYPLPTMVINTDKRDIFDFTIDDFTLKDYQYHPMIKGEVSI